MSYYQKYRPEKIEELDLGQAREAFKKMMAAGEIAHAYLLVGPRGSGKTSSARILARLVNCEKNTPHPPAVAGVPPLGKGRGNMKASQLLEPCGKCEACVSIKNGSAVDVMEIDAASHRGIDDIRDLREKVRLAPASLPKKVYIIDEVHMLTTEAFNALLKTLEEPPSHAMFILCTTEAHKIPGTIASRCVRINFTKAGREELVTSLMRAAAGEGLSVDKEALELLADSVDGSFREGHKLLEQLAVSGETVTAESVRAGLKLSGTDQVRAILAAVAGGRAKEVIEIIKVLENEGAEVADFVSRLLSALREKIAETIDSNKNVDRGKVRLVNSLIKVVPKLKVSPLPFLPLEMALLGACGKEPHPSPPLRKERGKTSRTDPEVVQTPPQPSPSQGREREISPPAKGESQRGFSGPVSFDQVESGWQELLSHLAPRNHSTAGLLRSARPKEIKDKFLTIEVFYKFHKEQLEQEARRKMIEEEVARMWGPISVRCVLGEKTQQSLKRAPEVENISGKVADDEVIRAAEEIFGA